VLQPSRVNQLQYTTSALEVHFDKTDALRIGKHKPYLLGASASISNSYCVMSQQSLRQISLTSDPSRFLEVFNYGPILETLGKCLAIADVVAVTRTCKQLSKLYAYLIPTQWNVDTLLKRFVEHPKELRAQIGKHNALISGSFALQFFERPTRWEAADINIYVERGNDATCLSRYLIEQEGYTIQLAIPDIHASMVDHFFDQASASTLSFRVNAAQDYPAA